MPAPHDHSDHDHDHDHAREGHSHDHDRAGEGHTHDHDPAREGQTHDHAGHDHDHAGHDHDHAGHDHDHAGHDHDHAAQLRSAPVRRLAQAFALTAGFMAVEVVAGLVTHSLALLSDAVHMLTDAAALLLALLAQRMAARRPTARHTYGFRRAETLAAFVNGVFLVVSSLGICVEAIARWRAPQPVQGGAMFVVAAVGLAVNLVAAWLLSRGEHGHNLNTRAALAHVISDAAGSVAAMVAAGLIVAFGWTRADPAASLLLSVLILWGAWRLVQQTVDVLMEVVPPKVDVPAIGATIRATPGVREFHDLHVWAVAEGFPVLTVHVVLDGSHHGAEVSRAVSDGIARAHGITHVTVQPEAPATEAWVPRERLVRRPPAP